MHDLKTVVMRANTSAHTCSAFREESAQQEQERKSLSQLGMLRAWSQKGTRSLLQKLDLLKRASRVYLKLLKSVHWYSFVLIDGSKDV